MRNFLMLAAALLLAACQTVPDIAGFTREQVELLDASGFARVGDHFELGMQDRLLFEFDKDELRAEQSDRLHDLSAALLAVGIGGAIVEGNTDSVGTSSYNMDLSLRRAQAVKSALVSGGMRADRISAVGNGESNPLQSNRTAAGRSENRRVVMIVSPSDRF
ncbi:MAG: OmpA family protein [Novosphingobium sp.]|nr:OmpA family protein [Novosphingobium sp.]